MRAPKIPAGEYILSFSRSSGAGGQNVNKLNTKATLRWNPDDSKVISDEVRERFKLKYASRINESGELIISSQKFRSQQRNLHDCLAKLESMLSSVILPPKARKPTRPKKAAVEKRLDEKRRQGERKRARQKGLY